MKYELKLYTPHEAQLKVHESKARYRVASFGRQSGKSTFGTNELLKHAWENPETRYWFVSPTYEQAKVQYRRTVAALWDCQQAIEKNNQTELRIMLINGSEITFKSGDNFENLRGETLHGVIVDEVRDQAPELWSMVLRPMLSTTKGWAAFISTPAGFDSFYDLAEIAKNDTSGNWEFFHAPSTCNPLFTQEEFDQAKRDMSEAQFAQEILAEFRDLTAGRAYLNFGSHNLLDKNPWGDLEIVPYLPIIIGCDFNLSPMAWSMMQNRVGHFYVFDELFLRNSNTQEAAHALASKINKLKSECGFNAPVIICGDATSKAGQRAAAGQSDYDIMLGVLKHHGINAVNQTPESNPQVKDRINTMNMKLKNAAGTTTLWINRFKCINLRKDFERVVWKDGVNAILDQVGSNKELTHISDSVGYAVYALDGGAFKQNIAGGLRIIPR